MTDQRPGQRTPVAAADQPAAGGSTHPLGCRLHRIEGQVRGVLHMLERGRSTDEVLVQLASIRGALHSLEQLLVSVELDRVVEAVVRDGRPAAEGSIEDLKVALGHLPRL